MNELMVVELLEVFGRHGIVSPLVVRNAKIRYEFKMLRAEGRKSKWIREFLAERYFVSEKTVEGIIYMKEDPPRSQG